MKSGVHQALSPGSPCPSCHSIVGAHLGPQGLTTASLLGLTSDLRATQQCCPVSPWTPGPRLQSWLLQMLGDFRLQGFGQVTGVNGFWVLRSRGRSPAVRGGGGYRTAQAGDHGRRCVHRGLPPLGTSQIPGPEGKVGPRWISGLQPSGLQVKAKCQFWAGTA